MLATTSPSPSGLVVHQCTGDQAVDLFYVWSQNAGWNPGQKEGIRDVMLKTDPGAYFYGKIDAAAVIKDNIGITNNTIQEQQHQQKQKQQQEEEQEEQKEVELGKDPTVVSVISAIRFGDEQAWIGCYITDAKYRGRGYGIATFNRALDHVGHTRQSVGLNAVLSQVENYRKSGFTQSSWVNERRRGPVRELVEVQERELVERIESGGVDGLVVMLSDARCDLDQLFGIERRYTGFNRPKFVKDWAVFHANHPEERRVGVAFLSQDKKDERTGKPLILGYGCVRPGVLSYRVGPLYAVDAETAKTLL
ncbi:hypothetical protein BGX23_011749, partial [Mortierella sp. AD031]